MSTGTLKTIYSNASNTLTSVAVDNKGNIYIADITYNKIVKITNTGTTTIIAGTGGIAKNNIGFTLNKPYGIAVDDNTGDVYITDTYNHRILKIKFTVSETNGIKSDVYEISVHAGTGTAGSLDGQASIAKFNYPKGIAVDSNGNVYVGDQTNNKIRKIDVGRTVSTFAGNGNRSYANGPANNSSFNLPNGVAVDSNGNVYVADMGNNMIRKIDAAGTTVSTIAGSGQLETPTNVGDGQDPTLATFNAPRGVAVDSQNNIFIADTADSTTTSGHRIRKIDVITNKISTIAGKGTPGTSPDGTIATNANLNTPMSVAVDSIGSVYYAEYMNGLVRKITYPIPITTVPNTTTPNTTVPNTTTPNTTVPNTTFPNTTVPNTTFPNTTVPNTTFPNTTVPNTTFPNTTVPNTTFPNTTVPNTTFPNTTFPNTTSPNAIVPTTLPAFTITPFTITTAPVSTEQSMNSLAPTTLPPFTIDTPIPTNSLIQQKEITKTNDSLLRLHEYIASKNKETKHGHKTIVETRADDSKELVMVQNNTLILGTMSLAILIIGGIIIFDY